MMITIASEIKHVENSLEVLNAIELDLERILVKEYEQGLPSDLDSAL